MPTQFCMSSRTNHQDHQEPQLVCKNTFLEFSAVAPKLRKSSSLPTLCSSSDYDAIERSTECSTNDNDYESSDEAFEMGMHSPASTFAEPPFSVNLIDIGMLSPITRTPYVAPCSASEFGGSTAGAVGASMRLLVAMLRVHQMVIAVDVVPKKRNVLKIFSNEEDKMMVLNFCIESLENAEFVCGQPRLGRKEAQIKLRIFDQMPGDASQICPSFAKKGKCKWNSCKNLHPRTVAAVISI